MSGNIAVIYTGHLGAVAEAFGEAAGHLAARVRVLRPLWRSGRLYDTVVTVFTDEPEHMAPDSLLHPIYDALYLWGAVIMGPRGFELELLADPGAAVPDSHSSLSMPRLTTAQHRAYRLARLAGVLATDRARRERVEL